MSIASSSVVDFVYQGEQLNEVAMPLGGIGTGCISLEGRGSLRDWEIFNRPNKSSILPMTFATLWCRPEDGTSAGDCRVVQGPATGGFIGHLMDSLFSAYGSGLSRNQGNGLPGFASATFRGIFPFAGIEFEQPGHPLAVSLEAFNPFVPLDVKATSMPVACLTYRLRNRSKVPVRATLAFNLHNAVGYAGSGKMEGFWFAAEVGDQAHNVFREGTGCRGLLMSNSRYAADHPRHGTMALTTDWPDVTSMPQWTGTQWFDSLHHFWDTFSPGGELEPGAVGQPGLGAAGSIGLRVRLAPGESADLPILISWCFPNFSKYWGAEAKLPDDQRPKWTNHYAKHWPTAWHAAEDFFAHRTQLTSRTRAFQSALRDSTLPPEVIESVSATASVLHSPTCLQLEDGTFYGWEGCGVDAGSCEGSCTHVWNYALTQAFLFPGLHRTMRRAEYQYSFESGEAGKKGAIVFRIPLPLGTPTGKFDESGMKDSGMWGHAASDGQLGGVVQLYRDWRLCGDEAYLRFMWPHAKKALEYAWHQWDRDRDGLVDGDQHNTYDINFQGPNPLTQGFYLAALTAGERMARHLGDAATADEYRRLADNGRRLASERLFNGEYFEQDFDCLTPNAPKYQHGKGCLTDQVFGQLAAHVAGLGYVFDEKQSRSALAAVFRHNFRDPLGDHANMQRIYAVADESGLLMCSWPRGGRPAYPFVYSDEVWTGVEYQVASHLIYEGMVEDGLAIVRAIRRRHDGTRRNPYNEFECGSHYARALASWGVLLALSGFRYDAVDRTLHVTPRGPNTTSMRCLFTTGSAWGTFEYADGAVTLRVIEGEVAIDRVVTPRGTSEVPPDRRVAKAGEVWRK